MFSYCNAVESYTPNDHKRMKNLVMIHVQPELLDVTALLPLLNKYLPMKRDDNYILMNPLIAPTERAMALLYKILPKKVQKLTHCLLNVYKKKSSI